MSVGGCRLLLESVSYKNSKIQSCLEVTGQVPIVVTGFFFGGGGFGCWHLYSANTFNVSNHALILIERFVV